MVTFKEKVKTLRQKKGMNQKQLSDASDITQATISRIEAGLVKQLKSDALKRLSEALGVTVDYLVSRTDRLTASDLLDSDPDAQQILEGYEKLSAAGREQLIKFTAFLQEQEGIAVKKKR